MRILIVAMTESIHTTRWINQLVDTGWDIHVFPSMASKVHPSLRKVTIHSQFMESWTMDPSVRVKCLWPFHRGTFTCRRVLKYVRPSLLHKPAELARLIRRLNPDVVHSLEIQHAGYLTLEARRLLQGTMPPWIVTNWGSDVFFFGRLPSHAGKIKEVLAACDWYSCECLRDVALARQFGLQGRVLPVFPNAGGFDLDHVQELRSPGPVSGRRWLIVKGYQNWAGRALVGLRALELCARELQPYQIAMYSAYGDMGLAAEMFTHKTGIPITILPSCSHEEMLSWFGRSRLYLGVSASDGICTSMLEAMVMGAFPVQSNTACADEWLVHGETGMIVPPEDPHIIAEAVHRALIDDALVDTAAEKNLAVARMRMDRRLLQPMAIDFYNKAVQTCKPSAARELVSPAA